MTMRSTQRTFCRICIASCGLLVTVDGDQVVGASGDPDDPLSRGYTCAKGRALPAMHHDARRLEECLVRRDDALVPVSRRECLDDLTSVLVDVAASDGTDAIAFFLGGGGYQDAAAYWAARRLQAQLGTTHRYSDMTIDSAAKTLVTDLMAGTPSLVPHACPTTTLLLLVGTNPVVSHGQTTSYADPVERIREARRRGQVWVLDPRATESARLADRHLALRAGTDDAVLAFLLRDQFERGLDRTALERRACNVDELEASVAPFDRDRVSEITGLEPAVLDELAAAVRDAGRLAVVTGTGTTMSASGNVVEWLAWALLVVTESFDRPGGMWFNPGYFARLDERDALPASPPPAAGPPSRPDIPRLLGEWPAALLAEEIEAGRVRALVVLGGNLVTALPETSRLLRALDLLEALAVFEVRRTETVDVATHVIACPDQLERSDLPTLDLFQPAVSTRYTAPVVPRPARLAPMWRSLAELGRGLGVDVLGDDRDPEAVSDDDVLARIARGRDLDELRAAEAPVVTASAVYGWAEPRLPRGRWDLAPPPLVAQLASLVAARDDRPALVVTPRRQPRHMNGQHFRSGDEPTAHLHPDDADAARIADGDLVELVSAAGALRVRATVTEAIARGAVSVPHGWGDTNVNQLVSSTELLDPLTGMPRLSGTPVTIRALTDDSPVPPVPASGPTA
jgi:anaerobic selenocysteine-containing dehydrogenase